MAVTKKRCMHCMNELSPNDLVCPHCAYSCDQVQAAQYLPHGIILKGRYLIGNMIKRNADSAVYIGYDIQNEKIIEIREFFAYELCVRDEDGIHIKSKESQKKIYDEYLRSFIQLWRNLMRFRGLPALFDVNDVFEFNGSAYAVTDHNDSTTFRKVIENADIENNPMPLSRVKQLIGSILSTVESLHTAGVVHRGISPETLILTSDGNLKITGFAIAQVRTSKNKLISSLYDGYSAIEQYDFNWQQGSWTDIYGIGAVLYKLLTGRTMPAAYKRLSDEEIFFTEKELETIPANIILLIKKCLRLMPQERLKNIRDITVELASYDKTQSRLNSVSRSADISFAKLQSKTNIKSEEVKQSSVSPIVKPKQGSGATRTSQPKAIVISEEDKLKQKKALEEEKRRRELKERERLERLEQLKKQDAERRQKEKEEIRRRNEELRKKNEEIRKQKRENSALNKVKKELINSSDKAKKRIKKEIQKERNPVVLGVSIAAIVSLSCILVLFTLYGTVLFKAFDAPVLDNCLSYFSFLPINKQEEEVAVKYVDVANFYGFTKEYIENDSSYKKRYNIIFDYDYCDTVASGYVFKQSVNAGEKIPQGSSITVYISKGIEMITFFDVRTLTYEEAFEKLSGIGFNVTSREVYNSGLHRQNTVGSQSLTVGESYPKGTDVVLEIWSAPPTIFTPPTTSGEQQNNSDDRRGGLFSFLEEIFGFGR